jgi:hypothetical protein
MGSPPGGPTHCVTRTTAPRALCDKSAHQGHSNWMDAVKLQLVRQYQRLSLSNFPETVIGIMMEKRRE